MPIRPENRSRYPKEWPQIRAAILERAEHKCEKCKALAQEGLAKTPTPRTYRIDGNELKVIDVPVLDSTGLLDVQRCFVWRDQEFRSSTLSCGQMPEIFIHKD